ncbi:MAG: hypothetical protein ACE10D_13265 [Planctomycetota bacterium]|nr:hypothetical protein [Planctomycetota bacterium]
MTSAKTFLLLPAALLLALLPGCQTEAQRQTDEVRDARTGKKLTTGVVQREIRKGMPSADVAEALGSPNIVSTDEDGREVWIYERFATDVTAASSGWFILWHAQKSVRSSTQRTLTVIVKFDHDHKVRDFAYHSSSF